jgi:hypothetical protein
MALFVGLDVSLRTTSICVVEADGSTIWEGKAESEPAPLVKTLTRWRLLWESKRAQCPNGFMVHTAHAIGRQSRAFSHSLGFGMTRKR